MSVINIDKRSCYLREDYFSLMLLGMGMAWECCMPTDLQSTVLLPSHFHTFSFSETCTHQQEPTQLWKTWCRKDVRTAHSKG